MVSAAPCTHSGTSGPSCPSATTETEARWWKVFDEAASAARARRGLQAIVADYRSAYPVGDAVIDRDFGALVAHLRWPSEHGKRIRTTNLLEGMFVEVRRRTKVIGRFPGETSALSLIWAVLDLFKTAPGAAWS
jgi:putative transposase